MKSPAINFYTSDFLTGTAFMNNEQVGAYIRLLSYQHQLGHLTEEQVFSITKDNVVLSKFKTDKNNLYFNERMEEEIKKRKKYSESRARNRSNSNKKSEENEKTYEKDMKNICNSYEKHMENEIKNINIYKNKEVNKSMREEETSIEEEFESLWSIYPNKRGKTVAMRKYSLARKQGATYEEVRQGLEHYIEYCKSKNIQKEFIKHGSTWFNQKCWDDDYEDNQNLPKWFNKQNETDEITEEEKKEMEDLLNSL